jgi:hypothetical protein
MTVAGPTTWFVVDKVGEKWSVRIFLTDKSEKLVVQ